MIAYTCKYAPAEMLAGFGETPKRLDPSPASFSCAENCTHPNMCSFAKAVIEEVHDRKIRRLILTDCCDATRRAYDALKAEGKMEFLWLLPLPHKDGKPEKQLFQKELRKLADAYADFSGQVFDAGRAAEACRKAVEEGREKSKLPSGDYIRVLGAHGGSRLLELVRETFPDVPVRDDTCSGNRTLEGEVGAPEDFFDWYAPLLLGQKHACMRMYQAELVSPRNPSAFSDNGREPAGTVFHTIKFCDYYGFAEMSRKDPAEKMIRIETDTTGAASGQLRTRLEAFREELGNLSKERSAEDQAERSVKDQAISQKGAAEGRSGSHKGAAEGRSGDHKGACEGGPENQNRFDRTGKRSPAGSSTFQYGQSEEKTSDGRQAAGIPDGGQTAGINGMYRKDLDSFYVAGIDSGSTSTDVVIMNGRRRILARIILPTAAGAENSSEEALGKALKAAGISREELHYVVTTGYGRAHIGASDKAVTEITCHARGAHFLCPEARTVIDIGGQDSKVIRLDANGRVQNFVMNDKCAAGTGRFLETQAKTMGLSMEEMSREGLRWQKDITITSMCTVFAESEVVSLIAGNTPPGDIIHGLNKAVARRTAGLVRRLNGEGPYIMTGGVAQNEGVAQCLSEELGETIRISEDSQLCGAIGACLAGLDANF